MKNIFNYLKLIRIKHWLKNFLIVLPALFAGILFNKTIITNLILGFFSFSFVTSCIYVYNDIKDIEKDKKHPKKRNRPLAAGVISIKSAIVLLIILSFFTISLNIYTSFKLNNYYLLVIPIIYLIINSLYSIKLKEYPIIDVLILSVDYLLRLLYGSLLTSVTISNWLYLVVMFVSLFMGFGKRKTELEAGSSTRNVLKKYNMKFLDKSMYQSMTCAIVFYSLWTIDVSNKIGNNYRLFKFSIPLVVLILFLYSYLIESDNTKIDGDPIEMFFSNKWLIILSLIYCLFMIVILYGV